MQRKKVVNMSLFLAIGITLVACGLFEVERNAQETAIAASIFTTQRAQAPAFASTPTVLPTSLPTIAPGCPMATADTLLLNDEDGGYCLLYPEGYGVVIPFAGEVCLVLGEPPFQLLCHGASLLINVEAANGRTADQVANALIAEAAHTIERSTLTLASEAAVMLEPFYDQATTRKVLIVRADWLYTLNFVGPWDDDGNPELAQAEQFYSQIIGSFVFLR